MGAPRRAHSRRPLAFAAPPRGPGRGCSARGEQTRQRRGLSFEEVTDIFKQIIGFPALFSLIIMCIYISLLVNLVINDSIFVLLWAVSSHPSHRRFYLEGTTGAFGVLSFAKHIIPLSLQFCLFVE